MSRSAATLQFIFIASHGISDPINPADGSFLALTNKHLFSANLRKLKLLAHPVVVMSACQSGLGKTFSKEIVSGGVFGLAEAWRFADASQVIMSLWNVSDDGTKQLMGEFMKRVKGPADRSTEYALADAMRELKKTERDPAIWAAFSVMGDPVP